MAKKRKEPDPPPGVPAWMATFSDLVTLLLTFFVMLMAMASFDDVNRVNALLSSLHDQLGSDGFDPKMLGPGDEGNMSPTQSAEVALSPLLARLAQAFREHLSNSSVQVDAQDNELRIDVPEGAFFRENSSEVHPGGYGLLAQVSDLMAAEDSVTVDVQGFSTEGESAKDRLLSARRAVAVITRLREHVPGQRISATAFGPQDDVSMKDSGEAWSRRIGLVFRTGTVSGRTPLQDLDTKEDPHGR